MNAREPKHLSYGAKLLIAIKIVFLGSIIVIVATLWIPIKDVFFEVPYLLKIPPSELGKHDFKLNIELPCNHVYLREIGFIIDPPIPLDSMANAYSALTGNATVIIKQGKITKTETIDFSGSGWSANSRGIWSQAIFRYKPLGSVFCSNQYISVKVSNINIDLNQYNVKVYVSRDRRP